jgi:serine/threonine protein kinase
MLWPTFSSEPERLAMAGDLKLHNFLIYSAGRFKIADFGLARAYTLQGPEELLDHCEAKLAFASE